ncbi:golgin subfamily A member 6-like protein 1 [Theropithecus gelada]|uniref:golgin subfamily A member 6-like protein 1 n=1 Tax=Theropithecus gelada TaxID=9565 RepID=UPI000DC19451|nr:golgin subfamily A member 6-like protein 1 [Theropithecus gelada]
MTHDADVAQWKNYATQPREPYSLESLLEDLMNEKSYTFRKRVVRIKPRQRQGAVTVQKRPENSLLEETLRCDHAVRMGTSHSYVAGDWRCIVVLAWTVLVWPQPHRPTHPMMSEETLQKKLAKAKEKLRDSHPQTSPSVGRGATDTKKKKINNGANPETTTSGGCHSPEDEKKASHQHQEALRRELEAQVHTIRILTCEKAELQTALYYSQRAVQQLQGESRHLVGRLHDSWKFAGELERALSAVATQKKKADRYVEELTKERDALSLELYRNTITDDELKEKNAELQEKLQLVESEKSEIQLNVKELKRKLEKAKLLLPQQQLQEEADHLGKELQSVSAKLQAQVEENKLWNRLYQQQEEKMWKQEEKIQEQVEKIREQEEKIREQEEKIREQEEKMRRQEEKMREKEEKMREQDEKIREQEEKMQRQEEQMRRQEEEMREKEEKMREQEEKMWEQEEKMWRQEEKMHEQDQKMWRQEEKMHDQEEKMRRQEEMMWEKEEKIREQEEKMWRQEEKMREKEEKMQRQEEKMREQETRLWQQEEMQKQEVRLQELEERLGELGRKAELWGSRRRWVQTLEIIQNALTTT